MFEWHTVPAFGGGLHLAAHPAFIRDDQWSWGMGWLAQYGAAEVLPGYATVGNLPRANEFPTGVFQNPYRLLDGALIATVREPSREVSLFTARADGTVVELTDGGDAAQVSTGIGSLQFPANTAFLNGYCCVSYGYVATTAPAAGITSLLRWNGGTSYQRVLPVGFAGFLPGFLRGFGGHLVAAYVGIGEVALDAPTASRTLHISDANNELDWLPSNANSADSALLDDALFGINGLELVQHNLLAVCARSGLHALQPTGGIPPFTRTYLGGQGVYDDIGTSTVTQGGNVGFYTPTPFGTAFRGFDNLYLGDQPIGTPIVRYYQGATSSPDGNPTAGWLWHGPRGCLGVPITVATGEWGILWYDPQGRAWSQQRLPPFVQWTAHGMVTEQSSIINRPRLRHWLASRTGVLATEGTDPVGGEFVDTKDFAFDSPSTRDYVDRIKVDWEPLAATTDALDVYVSARNDWAEGWVGTPGFQTSAVPFTYAGTLVGGASELALRVQGKFVRVRFQQRVGRPRIRGFSLRRERASDRTT